ncbi:MAG: efflux RND transporter periplasmic adaptor subunit [Desulfobacterales bacterium]|nr:efflux RND transporter periplasmic adaptor subunit [Desulfobacterales bacterium]
MMKKKKKLIIPILGVIVVGAFIYFTIQKKSPNPKNPIRVSGNIETTLVKVSFKIPGRISRLLVDEGYGVKEGDLIATLEDKELIDQKNKAEASLQALQSKIPALLTTTEKEEKTSSDEINRAEASLRAAQARLSDLLSGSRPQEIEQAKAEVERTRSELERAEKFYARATRLVQGGYVAVQEFDTTKEAYEVALAMHKKAMENYDLLKEGPRKEEIERARAQVEEAKATVSFAQSKKLQVKIYRQELDVLKAQINEARAALELPKRQLEYSEIFAPTSGVVLTKSAEEGEYVSPGAIVVTIADLDHVWLKAYVDETDLGRVKLGQKVRIKTDTFPNQGTEGKISFISSEAEFTPKQVQTQKERVKLVYRIKVDVENLKRELKPGMPADGEIQLEK